MKVVYQHGIERKTAMDKAVEQTPGNIRLRMQPLVYQQDKGNYLSWRGVSWTVVLEDQREANQFRSALAAFFVRLNEVGAEYLRLELDAKNAGIPLSEVLQIQHKNADNLSSLTDSQS